MGVLELAHDAKLLFLYETCLWQVDRRRSTAWDKDTGRLRSLPPSREWSLCVNQFVFPGILIGIDSPTIVFEDYTVEKLFIQHHRT